MIPEPVTNPSRDIGYRMMTAYDLEVTLVAFIAKLVDGRRLDNPTLNLAQATEPEHPIVTDPDQPPVSYFPRERGQTLALKVAPNVYRGRVPRTITGEIDVDKLPDVPAIVVQCVAKKTDHTESIATVRILINCYDENPDGSGYQDTLNLCETIEQSLGSFGQQAIDKAYPIVFPMDWKMIEADTFPHYIAEMTTQWELPAPRPLPDQDTFGIVPAEHLEVRASQGDPAL